MYGNILKMEGGEFNLKATEELIEDGYEFQWSAYVQLRERFKEDKKNVEFEVEKSIFVEELSDKQDSLVSRIYKRLLKYDTDDEQDRDCMVKWA